MRRALLALLAVAVAGAVVFYLLTTPPAIEPASALPAHTPDLANGKYMFTAGGCAECHAVPVKKCDGLKTKDKVTLAGGRCLKTPYGTFHVPNISPDKETGIGNWTTLDFINAMKHGVAPDGSFLYPAFPFGSYQRMSYEDLIDLKAYLDSLPAVKNEVPAHELGFPFNIRRGLGLWHKLYVDGESFVPDPHASAELNRGAYLVTGPGLQGVPLLAQPARWHRQGHGIRRRAESRGQRQRAEHHAEQRRDRRLERGRCRLSAGDREYARLRRDWREHGAGAGGHGEANGSGSQGHRRLYQVAAAAPRRRAQIEAERRREGRHREKRRR